LEQQEDIGEYRHIGFSKAKENKGFILQPGDFAIAPIFERVRLPNNIVGRLDGRSSLGRLGLIIHATAGGIDPGYTGLITCELSNLGKVPVALHPLQRIAALTLETLEEDAVVGYRYKKDKKYANQLHTMLRSDKEFTSKILDDVAENL
jgi:dCTP deaminase